MAGVTIASQLINQQSPSSPSPISVDYSRLEGFLKAGEWKDADQETANLMLEVANREKEDWLDTESIQNFPCEVLSKIDRLWVDSSGGKFGFSVQKQIYIEHCGGKPDGQYDEKAWQCFGDRVGWRVKGNWITYDEVTFNTQAPRGHLPKGWGEILGKQFHLSVGNRYQGGASSLSSLSLRLVNCSR